MSRSPNRRLGVYLPHKLEQDLENAAARLGCSPAVLAKLCIQQQYDTIGFDQVEAEGSPALSKLLKRRAAAKAAREAMEAG
jgi:hypothetical protein